MPYTLPDAKAEARRQATATAQASTRAHLTALYGVWLQAEGLPEADAEELLHADLSPHQRRWVSAFVLLWDAMESDTSADRDATATALRNFRN